MKRGDQAFISMPATLKFSALNICYVCSEWSVLCLLNGWWREFRKLRVSSQGRGQ